MQKTNQQEFRIVKVIKKKGNKLYVKWKRYDNSFNSRIDKKINIFLNHMALLVETLMSKLIYLIMQQKHLKNISHVSVSSFALKSNLASLKPEVDKLDIQKLIPIPNDLAQLSNAVKNDVVKKTVYDKLVAKVNNTDTPGFVLKTYDTDKSDLEKKSSDADKKIPDASDLAKKTDLNAKNTKIESKIPSITGLTTNSALTAVENKIPDVSSLVKKTDYNTKISEIENKVRDHHHDKYITTPEFNILAERVFNARLAQASLVPKIDFDSRLQSLDKKINPNKTMHLLVETELKLLEKFGAAYFRGKNYFDDDGTQNYLVF